MKINLLLRFFLLSFFGVVVLVFFTAAQTQQWLNSFDGAQHQPDEAFAIYADAAGNSYVAGFSYTLNGENMAVIKYYPNGDTAWARFNYDQGQSLVEAMAVDQAGDVFVTGVTNNLSNYSYAVLKYDSSGVLQWNKSVGIAGPGFEEGIAITTDANYVYVTGTTTATSFPNRSNYKTAKLDIATGTLQSGWPQIFNGTGNSDDVPTSIAVDNSGNVFVTGSSLNSSGNKDYVTIGYDASGTKLAGWPKSFDGDSATDDTPYQILLSGSNVIVTGICNQGLFPDTTGDIGTIMYTYSGAVVSGWPQVYNGTGNSWDGVSSTYNDGYAPARCKPMAVDGAGNVYVGGWTMDSSGVYNMITFKYGPAGDIQGGWPQIYHTAGRDNIIRALALDASNDVCITGFSAPGGTLTNGDYVTIEYDPSGNTMPGWPVIYDGAGHSSDQALAITAVGTGIYITGYANQSVGFNDITTIKYSNANLSVGVKNVLSDHVVVYPNPSSGRFTIHNLTGESQLTIINTLGETVYETKVTSAQADIDLSKEAKGIYFYKITGDNSFVHQGKLVIL